MRRPRLPHNLLRTLMSSRLFWLLVEHPLALLIGFTTIALGWEETISLTASITIDRLACWAASQRRGPTGRWWWLWCRAATFRRRNRHLDLSLHFKISLPDTVAWSVIGRADDGAVDFAGLRWQLSQAVDQIPDLARADILLVVSPNGAGRHLDVVARFDPDHRPPDDIDVVWTRAKGPPSIRP